ncbi:hypothetical protein RYX36_012124 [Vicia faba]
MAIESSKDGKQSGAMKEFETNMRIRELVVWNRSWTNWRSRGAPVKGVGGGKLGGSVSGENGSGGGEKNESGKDRGSEPMEEEDEKI